MRTAKILILEDDAITSLALRDVLSAAGYPSPLFAGSGEEAVQTALENDVDLLLADIRLGSGISGVEAVNVIRKYKDLEVIYFSGSDFSPNSPEVVATNPVAYLLKPLNFQDLLGTVDSYFAGSLGG